MGVAANIVSRLLEDYNPYDIDDPLDLPEFPGGFIASSPEGERFEVKLTEFAGAPAYHWVKFWWNEYSQSLEPFDMGHARVKRGEAQNYIQAQAEKYADGGWRIEFL
jgi:hypothetical protein